MGASADRDPLHGDVTPVDPARIGSGLVQDGDGDESSVDRSVTSMGVKVPPGVHAKPSHGASSLATPGLRGDLLENHPERDERNESDE
jgi:hypothetical protein